MNAAQMEWPSLSVITIPAQNLPQKSQIISITWSVRRLTSAGVIIFVPRSCNRTASLFCCRLVNVFVYCMSQAAALLAEHAKAVCSLQTDASNHPWLGPTGSDRLGAARLLPYFCLWTQTCSGFSSVLITDPNEQHFSKQTQLKVPLFSYQKQLISE